MANKQDIIDALNEEYNETLVWDEKDDWNLWIREGIRTAINCINRLWDQHEDVAPVVHGHLIFHKDELDGIHGKWIDDGDPLTLVCGVCGYRVMRYNNTKFCPNCGTRLEGGR